MTDARRRHRTRRRRPGDTVRSGVLIGLAATLVGQGSFVICFSALADGLGSSGVQRSDPVDPRTYALIVIISMPLSQFLYMVPLFVQSEGRGRRRRSQGLMMVVAAVFLLAGLRCLSLNVGVT